jgi:hypothetical protein
MLAVLGSIRPSHASPFAQLTLQSEPGDFIGGGGSFDLFYTPQNSTSFSAQVRRTIGPDPAELLFVLGTVTSGSDNTFALLFFGTDKLGIPIQSGFYPDAQRADFASLGRPGLDVSFQNRGCNTLTGAFTVNQVTFSNPSTVQTFDASFVQNCEGAAPALVGTFTYNTSVPEPGTWVLMATGMILLPGSRRRFLRRGRAGTVPL